jgi:hypothetical protein
VVTPLARVQAQMGEGDILGLHGLSGTSW